MSAINCVNGQHRLFCSFWLTSLSTVRNHKKCTQICSLSRVLLRCRVFMKRPTEWLTDRITDWITNSLVEYFSDFTDRPSRWMYKWLCGWLTQRPIPLSYHLWRLAWMTRWLNDWCTDEMSMQHRAFVKDWLYARIIIEKVARRLTDSLTE